MPGMATPVADCPSCRGRGFVVTSVASGPDSARPCECRRAPPIAVQLSDAGVPARYRECTLDGFRTTGQSSEGQQLLAAKSQCRTYVEEFLHSDGDLATSGLLFVGRPGCGKTHLAVAVMRELMAAYGVRGRFVDFTDLIHRLQATFDPSSSTSKRQLLDPLRRADVLVLDELGAQKPSPFVQDVLYLLINGRYADRLPTLFTTNCALPPSTRAARSTGPSQEETGLEFSNPAGLPSSPARVNLAHRIQASLVSRLYEMARPILLDQVSDYREMIQSPRHQMPTRHL